MAEGEAKKGKDRLYGAPFVVALIMFIWLSVLFFNPDLVERTDYPFSTWVTIGYLVIIIMFIWLLVWKITLSTEVVPEPVPAPVAAPPKKKAKPRPPVEEEEDETPERPPPKPRKKRVVVAAGAAAAADEMPDGLKRSEDTIDEEILDLSRVIEYPEKEPGGVYSDTPVQVDEHLILNFRILLGKVCHNCEELEDCKRRVVGKLDEDVFLFNFDCKEGIKQELQKARKKREAEDEKAEAAKDLVKDKAEKAKEEEAEVQPEDEEAKAPEEKDGEVKERAPPKKKAPPKKGTTSKKGSTSKGGKKKKSSTSSKKGSATKK